MPCAFRLDPAQRYPRIRAWVVCHGVEHFAASIALGLLDIYTLEGQVYGLVGCCYGQRGWRLSRYANNDVEGRRTVDAKSGPLPYVGKGGGTNGIVVRGRS